MKVTTAWDRIQTIKKALGIETDAELGRIAGASKAVVNQWKSGLIQTISANYAYSIQDRTGFSARWIMTGEGRQSLISEPDARPLRRPLGASQQTQCSTLIAYIDNKRICRFANLAYSDWFGKSSTGAVGHPLKEVLGSLYEQSKTQLARAFAGQPQVFELSVPAHDGALHESIVSYMPDVSKEVVHGVCVYAADVSLLNPHERSQFFERQTITHYGNGISANADSRLVLKVLLDRVIRVAQRDGSVFSLVTIEIVNSTEIAEEIPLKAVGNMLKEAVEVAREIVHRLDFAVPLKDSEMVLSLSDMGNKEVPQRVVAAVEAVFRKLVAARTKKISLTLRAGVACYPEDGKTPAKLLRCARQALW